MFCFRKQMDKQKAYCKGMMIGSIFTAASIVAIAINKKIKCKNNKKNVDKQDDSCKDKYDEDVELKEKIDQFNSRRLTLENESKKDNY